MNIINSKRKLKALEILAAVNAHKKREIHQRVSSQSDIINRLEDQRNFIETKINASSISLGGGSLDGESFCPELYGAKLDYIQHLYENKGACDASLVKNNKHLEQAKTLLSEITSRVNLIDEKYMAEKMKYVTQIIKQQEAQ